MQTSCGSSLPIGESRRLEKGEPALVQGRAPRWSPDGKWIACTSTRPAPNPTEATKRAIWIISADGEQAYQLTGFALDPLHVAWSPDQKLLACGGSDSGLSVLELPEYFHAASQCARAQSSRDKSNFRDHDLL